MTGRKLTAGSTMTCVLLSNQPCHQLCDYRARASELTDLQLGAHISLTIRLPLVDSEAWRTSSGFSHNTCSGPDRMAA
jgi:hypothetical protein